MLQRPVWAQMERLTRWHFTDYIIVPYFYLLRKKKHSTIHVLFWSNKKYIKTSHVLVFIDKIVTVYNSSTSFDLHSYTYHRHLESNADQQYPQQWHTIHCLQSPSVQQLSCTA